MSEQNSYLIDQELTALKLQIKANENIWKKEKAILEQQVELQEIQILEGKNREQKLQHMHELFIKGLDKFSDNSKNQVAAPNLIVVEDFIIIFKGKAGQNLKTLLEELKTQDETNKNKQNERIIKLEKENREIKDKLFEKQLELQLLKGLSTTNNTQDFKLEEEEEEVQEYEGVIHKNGGQKPVISDHQFHNLKSSQLVNEIESYRGSLVGNSHSEFECHQDIKSSLKSSLPNSTKEEQQQPNSKLHSDSPRNDLNLNIKLKQTIQLLQLSQLQLQEDLKIKDQTIKELVQQYKSIENRLISSSIKKGSSNTISSITPLNGSFTISNPLLGQIKKNYSYNQMHLNGIQSAQSQKPNGKAISSSTIILRNSSKGLKAEEELENKEKIRNSSSNLTIQITTNNQNNCINSNTNMVRPFQSGVNNNIIHHINPFVGHIVQRASSKNSNAFNECNDSKKKKNNNNNNNTNNINNNNYTNSNNNNNKNANFRETRTYTQQAQINSIQDHNKNSIHKNSDSNALKPQQDCQSNYFTHPTRPENLISFESNENTYFEKEKANQSKKLSHPITNSNLEQDLKKKLEQYEEENARLSQNENNLKLEIQYLRNQIMNQKQQTQNVKTNTKAATPIDNNLLKTALLTQEEKVGDCTPKNKRKSLDNEDKEIINNSNGVKVLTKQRNQLQKQQQLLESKDPHIQIVMQTQASQQQSNLKQSLEQLAHTNLVSQPDSKHLLLAQQQYQQSQLVKDNSHQKRNEGQQPYLHAPHKQPKNNSLNSQFQEMMFQNPPPIIAQPSEYAHIQIPSVVFANQQVQQFPSSRISSKSSIFMNFQNLNKENSDNPITTEVLPSELIERFKSENNQNNFRSVVLLRENIQFAEENSSQTKLPLTSRFNISLERESSKDKPKKEVPSNSITSIQRKQELPYPPPPHPNSINLLKTVSSRSSHKRNHNGIITLNPSPFGKGSLSPSLYHV